MVDCRDPGDAMMEALECVREWQEDNDPEYQEQTLGMLIKIREAELRALRIDLDRIGDEIKEMGL